MVYRMPGATRSSLVDKRDHAHQASTAVCCSLRGCVALRILLVVVDPISALALLPYAVWLGYDVVWMRNLWRLNQGANGPVG